MNAVILAGGLGSRLKPFTEVIPKPLLPKGKKSVLEIQIQRLKKFGFNKIFLATNYKSNYIERFFGDGSEYGVDLVISKEEFPLGSAGPLMLLKDELTDPFIVMNGDILSLINFKEFYDFSASKDSLLTITIKKEITPFAFGNIFFKGDKVTGIQEKPDLIMYLLAGIYVMKPEIFNYFPNSLEYFGMDKLILNMLGKKEYITKYELKDYWLDIGRVDDYKKAQDDFEDLIEEKI